jgi:oxaloacetate decarboxylase gamma subunit|tara:strand:+ start:971 stop:1324 length:354 start_codon:yes stop_codon:yes gene_type:complete
MESKAILANNRGIAIVLPSDHSVVAFNLFLHYLGSPMDSTLISQGLDLMLYGMGTVFTFLTLLVGVTTLMSKVVNKLVIEQPEIAVSTIATAPVQIAVEPRIAKVIQAAIDQHRSKR